MIEFLKNNYNWIFSGIGVLIITLLFRLFRKRKSITPSYLSDKNNHVKLVESNNNSINIIDTQIQNKYEIAKQEDENENFTDIDPISIKEKIIALPPYQQEKIANNYIGLKIQWTLKLFQIQSRTGNKVFVTLEPIGFSYPVINFEIDIEKYPIFKIAEVGTIFEITGKITKCDRFTIQITLFSLKEKNIEFN